MKGENFKVSFYMFRKQYPFFHVSTLKLPWQAISAFILNVLHVSVAVHTTWLIQKLSPTLHIL